MFDKRQIVYRRATMVDCENCVRFTDAWLAGRQKTKGHPLAGNDYFISWGQYKSYLRTRHVLLALDQSEIVGWAVMERTRVLIHLLVHGDYRGHEIGGALLSRLNPDIIRSKQDQTTGDPASFYERNGYMKMSELRVGKKRNIELFAKRV